MDKQQYIISEIRESGGYFRRIEIHGYNPFGQNINFEIHYDDFKNNPVTIGDMVELTVEFKIQDG